MFRLVGTYIYFTYYAYNFFANCKMPRSIFIYSHNNFLFIIAPYTTNKLASTCCFKYTKSDNITQKPLGSSKL